MADGAGASRPQAVEPPYLLAVADEHVVNDREVVVRQGSIHHFGGGDADEAQCRPAHVGGEAESDKRVEDIVAGHCDQQQSRDNRARLHNVGLEVRSFRVQGHRV